jgi:hypothetical protein
MNIPVLIRPIADKGFQAQAGSPFDWTAEGATEEEAIAKLKVELSRHLSNGVRATMIEVPIQTGNIQRTGENPWLRVIGTLPDDEMTALFRAAVEEYRREIDADPNR